MKAGRELDALIAEKVMGWEVLTDELEIAKREGTPDLVDPQRWHRRKVWFKGNEKMACEECGTLPAYSTNITDAWEVVERLVSTPGPNGDHHSVQVDYSGDAVVVIDENEDWQVSAIADTAPLAICLAALKAVSQEGQHGQ